MGTITEIPPPHPTQMANMKETQRARFSVCVCVCGDGIGTAASSGGPNCQSKPTSSLFSNQYACPFPTKPCQDKKQTSFSNLPSPPQIVSLPDCNNIVTQFTVFDKEDEGGEAAGRNNKKKRVLTSSGRRASGAGGLTSRSCQVEDCAADMNDAKPYHRRHRVCEFHAKAPVVLVAMLQQRFCQQCSSRFHELSEFDDAKRSCRMRLAGHNERRRKSAYDSHKEETLK